MRVEPVQPKNFFRKSVFSRLISSVFSKNGLSLFFSFQKNGGSGSGSTQKNVGKCVFGVTVRMDSG
jgi:hypothetical protein